MKDVLNSKHKTDLSYEDIYYLEKKTTISNYGKFDNIVRNLFLKRSKRIC